MRIAQQLLDYQHPSMVGGGRDLAAYFLDVEQKRDQRKHIRGSGRTLAASLTERAEAVLGASNGVNYREAAEAFANAILDYAKLLVDHVDLVDRLTTVQTRLGELLEDRRTLGRCIERAANAVTSDARDQALKDGVTAVKAMP